ncbi:MAG: toxin-antitoxin system HicB family antitoxin [Anaerolineae bacterium]|nr:MAG: toxin-antitoxin system HicB family antitoxin [Anaerolineae bacterium]
MSRLTLRLPDSLHRQLEALARSESVSLNQYIVYALTRQVAQAYAVQALPEKTIVGQRAAYTALLQNLGRASFEEIRQVLDEREEVEPERGLTPEVLDQLKKRVRQQGTS